MFVKLEHDIVTMMLNHYATIMKMIFIMTIMKLKHGIVTLMLNRDDDDVEDDFCHDNHDDNHDDNYGDNYDNCNYINE